ncbi:MAG: LysE family translocator [Candidatus Baltobacteraceae bacterium]
MMHLNTAQALLFMATVFTVAVVPGPDVLYVVSQSLLGGWARGFRAVFGILVGFSIHVCIAMIGFCVLAAQSQTIFGFIREAGAVYLIYLGVRRLFLTPRNTPDQAPDPKAAGGSAFVYGLVTNVSNPKAALFTYSLLPQFISPERGPIAIQILVLGLLSAAIGLSVLSVYVIGASSLQRNVQRSRATAFIERFGIGTLFLGLGIRFVL